MTTGSTIQAKIFAPAIDWDETYWELMPRVFNFFSYRFGGNQQLAEELTAVTFEKAWRKRHRYRRDIAKFSTWVFTIARRTAIDHMRQQNRNRIVDIMDDVPSSDDENPYNIVQRKQTLVRLKELLNQLSEREQDIISLKFGAQLTNREIAHQMRLTESNVGSILHRSITRMRNQWEAKTNG